MVNELPPNHVDDVPVVEPNKHDNVSIVLEPVLVDEDEDPKKDEFEEEEDPQEEEDDMEVDIEEDENDPYDGLLPGLMRRDINSLFGNKVHSSVEQGTAAMERLVEKLGNAEDKAKCKKLKKELKEARGIVFEERPNEAIDVPVKDQERTLKES
uniref:Uncharacterized protein n=1 Tax=Tanacetum cinerariifolium TaxID=118510 RepID=A0A6L2KI35_TANCI|nr:hypothetical protein [Tanacetum cinerariifolium]